MGCSWVIGGKQRVSDSVNHARMEFDNGEVGQDALVRGTQVVDICGSSGVRRAERCCIVEGGFIVIGDCAWIGLGSVDRWAKCRPLTCFCNSDREQSSSGFVW